MKTRILSRADVGRIATEVGLEVLMDEMIDRLTAAISAYDPATTDVRERDGFDYVEPRVGLLEWMPVMHDADTTTIKVVGYHPANPSIQRLPTILSTISVYDNDSGHLIGLADGTLLTAMRTGAASAVASRILATPDARILGLIGCGAQGVTQAHALARHFDLNQILIADIDPAQVESFPKRVAPYVPSEIDIRPAPVDLLMQTADIVCTATSIDAGAGPLFRDLDTKDWLHINAVGSDFPGKIELPQAMLQRAFVCPDHRSQALKEGECQQLDPSSIGPDLHAIVTDPEGYRRYREQLTVFDSTGWALEDQVAVTMLLEHAADLSLGSMVEIEDVGDDPYDPYEVANGEPGQVSMRLSDIVRRHGA